MHIHSAIVHDSQPFLGVQQAPSKFLLYRSRLTIIKDSLHKSCVEIRTGVERIRAIYASASTGVAEGFAHPKDRQPYKLCAGLRQAAERTCRRITVWLLTLFAEELVEIARKMRRLGFAKSSASHVVAATNSTETPISVVQRKINSRQSDVEKPAAQADTL
jgi:hypothetical protein